MAMASVQDALQDAGSKVMTLIEGQPRMKLAYDYVHTHPWITLGVTLGAYVTYKFVTRRRNMPPGPFNFPLIGATRYLSADFYDRLIEDNAIYGDIIYLTMFGTESVVISNETILREILVKRADEFSNRHPSPFMTEIGMGPKDTIFTGDYDEEYRTKKKIAVAGMKNMGFGTPKSEAKIHQELEKFTTLLQEKGGEPVITAPQLRIFATSLLFHIYFNLDYPLDDPKVTEMTEKVMGWYQGFNESIMLAEFVFAKWPLLRMLFCSSGIAKTRKATQDMKEILVKMIQEHRASFDPTELRDLIDHHLKEDGSRPDDKIALDIILTFPDGVDTTALLMSWMFYCLAKNPEVQKKLQQEVDEVIGPNRVPSLSDKAQMPLAEGVVLETLRFADVVPFVPGRKVRKDTEVGGFTIPKEVAVMANLHAVHYNPDTFPSPDKFNPGRFVGNDGKLNSSLASHVIPFGVGPRMCIGSQYVKIELFLMIVHIAQKFTLTFDPSEPEPATYIDTTFQGMRSPWPHKICFTPR